MNYHTQIDDSMLQIHRFKCARTLDETEWSGILGKTGLGWKLLNWMQQTAAGLFEFGPVYATQEGPDEVLCFEVEGVQSRIELSNNQALTATLLGATRQVINEVNRALKRAQLRFRFTLERLTCAGHQSRYRLILAPRAWLTELGRSMHLVAGISPEDYERDMLAPGRQLVSSDLYTPDHGQARAGR